MIERIKQIVAQLIGEVAKTGIGTVYDYDPNLYAVRVELQPTGVITGWMPIASHWVGNGFGMVAGPNIGDMVRVDFIDGNWQAALMGARFFNDGATPPAVPSGECWLVHESGSLLKFHNDGTVEVKSASHMTATVGGNLTATATGAAEVIAGTTATVKASAINLQSGGTSLLKLLNSMFATWAASHTHGGVQTGTGTSGVPTTTPGSNTQTSVVQAE